jgi:hypothetical protein
LQFTSVDGTVARTPPSRTRSGSPSSWSSTWRIDSGVSCACRFALVTSSGPVARSTSSSSGSSGIRTATSSRPASQPGARSWSSPSASVSGPGENAASSRRAGAVTCAPRSSAWSGEATMIGRLRDSGRRFIANSRASAPAPCTGWTANPYTVSVGSSTIPPARSVSTTRSASLIGPSEQRGRLGQR